jgi:hypothetical protein
MVLEVVQADAQQSFLPLTLFEARWKYILLAASVWGVVYNLASRLLSTPQFIPYQHKTDVTKYEISLLKSECVSLVHSAGTCLLFLGDLVF